MKGLVINNYRNFYRNLLHLRISLNHLQISPLNNKLTAADGEIIMLTPKPAQSSALQYFLFVSSKKAGGSLTYKLQSPGVTPLPTPPVSLGQIFITKGRGCYNSKFLRGRPEMFRASIRIRAITFFFISLCNLVGYWSICESKLT